MPNIKSHSKFDSVNITQTDADYQYYDTYTEDRWCVECGCIEPDPTSLSWICSCCLHNKRVDQFGVPDYESEYWMESCCPTGESLRRSYELFHVIEPDQDQEFGPWPINTPSARFEKPEPPTLIILKTHKKITEERAAALAHENSIAAAADGTSTIYNWPEPKPLKEITPPPPTPTDAPDAPAPAPAPTGKYVPPGRRNRRYR